MNLSVKLNALFWMMRPLNSTTASIAVIVATFLAIKANEIPFNLITYIFIAAAAFFTTAQGMVHNDIVDYEVDKINAPHRPLPSKILTMKEAKLWAITLFTLACVSGFLIDINLSLKFPISLFWAAFNSSLLDIYNVWLKKSGLFGNLIVAYVVWALFIYADIVINHTLTLRVESIGLYAFFLNWGREVIKGIYDINGDKKAGIRTIAVRFGRKGGAIGGSILLFIAVLWSLPIILSSNQSLVVPIVLIIFDSLIIYRCFNLIKNPSDEYAWATKLLLLRLMFLALLTLSIEKIILVIFY